MKFKLVANILFEADDLDDAFAKLRDHFGALVGIQDDDDASPFELGTLDFVGRMEIKSGARDEKH